MARKIGKPKRMRKQYKGLTIEWGAINRFPRSAQRKIKDEMRLHAKKSLKGDVPFYLKTCRHITIAKNAKSKKWGFFFTEKPIAPMLWDDEDWHGSQAYG